MSKIILTQDFKKNLALDNAEIALAISGGADSICMGKLAAEEALLSGNNYIALIVDHGLRKESAQEAALVKKRLSDIGIESVILKWSGDKPTSNIQEQAREARYKLLLEYCESHNIKYLLTAHNKNDQAETVLMRILRGSGVDGVAGISISHKINGVNILRPLLEFSRDEIIATLKHYGIDWIEDPSNQNEKFERVRIRNLISSQVDKDTWLDRFSLLAKNARRTKDFLDLQVNKFIGGNVEISKLGYVKFKASDFNIHEEMKLRVLAKLLMIVSGKKKRHRLSSLENVNFKSASTLWDCQVVPKDGNVYIFKEASAVDDSYVDGIWDARFKLVLPHGAEVKRMTKDLWSAIKNNVDEKPQIHELIYSLPVVTNKDGKVIASPILKKSELQIDFIKFF